MRILVAGGAGYIGSQTAKLLARSGAEPVVLDNLSTGHQWAVRWGPLVVGDIGDIAQMRGVLQEYRPDAVIHFAANAYVGESMQQPRKYFQNNVIGSLSFLNAMVDAGVRRIVFSSTCSVYGIPDAVPISEQQPPRPVNPYGESKLFVERALHWYGEAYGVRFVALRYFNAAGADPEGEIGEDHHPEPHLVPSAIQTALGQRPHLEVYGTDYPTPDGTAVRDYVHVADLAEAHLRAIEYLLDGADSIVLNLGTGRGYSVRSVIAAVERMAGRTIAVREGPRRPGDPPVLIADPAKATRVLGWKPRFGELEPMVATAWRWHRRQTPR